VENDSRGSVVARSISSAARQLIQTSAARAHPIGRSARGLTTGSRGLLCCSPTAPLSPTLILRNYLDPATTLRCEYRDIGEAGVLAPARCDLLVAKLEATPTTPAYANRPLTPAYRGALQTARFRRVLGERAGAASVGALPETLSLIGAPGAGMPSLIVYWPGAGETVACH
jgi:hypothetical protein